MTEQPVPTTPAEVLAKGLVLMEFHYPAGRLADWLRTAEENGVLNGLRYRSSCGPFVGAKNIWQSERTGYLVHDCRRHGEERVKVVV